MEKKQKHLIATITLLIVLVLMYVGVKFVVNKKALDEDEQSEAKKIYVTNFNVEDVCKLSYEYSDEKVELELEDGSWKSVTDTALSIDSSKVEEIISYYNHLEANSVIEGGISNEEYGIATPTKELKITLNNGEVYKYTFGELNTLSSVYYMSLNESEDVYVIASVTANKFEKSITDLEEETTADTTTDTTNEDGNTDTTNEADSISSEN